MIGNYPVDLDRAVQLWKSWTARCA